VTIHTVQSLSKIQQRLDRQRRQAMATTAAMRKGAVLYHTMGESWRLSTGVKVSDEVARIVTFDHRVVGIGDSLFGVELSQTWRWNEAE
jgi:hypothetical protein